MTPGELREIIWDYYAKQRRDLPWRQPDADGTYNPYHILVSELMLQQTQVPRVIPKYASFLAAFPTIDDLAEAPLSAVLTQWQGLGYNRRAKYLHEAAKQLATIHTDWSYEQLVACKGIGPNTAAAVSVYTYDTPLLFIETNVRSVLLHHLFPDHDSVRDRELLEALDELLDREHPREFYWALMDYGTFLKQTAGNAARRSHHYKKQSTFKGSNRQLRGMIIRKLAAGPVDVATLQKEAGGDVRLGAVLEGLIGEGLIVRKGTTYQLAP